MQLKNQLVREEDQNKTKEGGKHRPEGGKACPSADSLFLAKYDARVTTHDLEFP